MKINKPLSVLLILSLCMLNACKKTDDDPALSLYTRKARVAGEWKVEKGSLDTESYSYNINGNTFVYSDPGGIWEGTSSVSFSFDKNGDCKTTIILGGFLLTYEGVWNFTGGVGEAKNKSQLVISLKKLKDSSGEYTFSGNESHITFDILELRNKKMRIRSVSKRSQNGTISYAYTESWDLIQ